MKNKLVILIILAVILFFIVDYIYKNKINSRINEQFNNINGSYEKFKQLKGLSCVKDYYNAKNNIIENFDNTNIYYKQYLYKIFSANNNDQISKLIIKNSLENINLDIIFNNVLDHEKINDITGEMHTAVINNTSTNINEYDIEDKLDCKYEISDNYDNNEYFWFINDLNEDLTGFTINFTNLNDNNKTYKIIINLKESLQDLYSNNVNIKQLFSSTILENIKLQTNDSSDEIEITSHTILMIPFSDFTVSRLSKYHENIKGVIEDKILDESYNNLKIFGVIQKNIDKLENYYKFKKNMEKNYMTYKTLD
jgi:hypothetical protein